MKAWQKWILVTLVIGAVSFVITPAIWPTPTNINPGAYLPLFVLLSVFESLAFGLGVAFLAFGYPVVARSRGSFSLNLAAYVSVAWFLVNWWPHDNLHKVVQFNIPGLLAIEYAFHVTLMLAGAILVLYFWRTVQTVQVTQRRVASGAPSPSTPT
jgi:hypothetical protein